MQAIGMIAEVLGWVGLAVALLFGGMWLVLRLARGRWQTAPAVVDGGEVRWMSGDGSFHTSAAPHNLAHTDNLMIFYRSRRPQVCYPEAVAHDEKTFRFVGLIVAVVAALAFAFSTISSML